MTTKPLLIGGMEKCGPLSRCYRITPSTTLVLARDVCGPEPVAKYMLIFQDLSSSLTLACVVVQRRRWCVYFGGTGCSANC